MQNTTQWANTVLIVKRIDGPALRSASEVDPRDVTWTVCNTESRAWPPITYSVVRLHLPGCASRGSTCDEARRAGPPVMQRLAQTYARSSVVVHLMPTFPYGINVSSLI